MKNLTKLFGTLFVGAIAVMLFGCNYQPESTLSVNDAIKKIGTPRNVYASERRQTRATSISDDVFAESAVVKGQEGIVGRATLIDYSEVKDYLKAAMWNYTRDDYSFQQGYPEFFHNTEAINDDDIFVELCQWKDSSDTEILWYELRCSKGKEVRISRENNTMQRGVYILELSPDLVVDIRGKKNLLTGSTAEYDKNIH